MTAKSWKRMFAASGAFAFALSASAAATIDVTKVQQRWPWNNKVDVTYDIKADNADKRVNKVTITTVIDGRTYTVYDGALNENAAPGTHTITWENAPAGVKSDTAAMNAAIYSALVPKGDDYMIIKLADGTIEYEGLFADNAIAGCTGQEISNARYNCDKYKSTHYPLRKIPKGTYKTGDSANFPSGVHKNTDATWTTDKDFYVGLFKWTNFQYWHVFDLSTDRSIEQVDTIARPLGFVRDIRGTADPAVPPTPQKIVDRWVVLEWLNAKTRESGSNLVFDLPTEIMHEIATRAGSETPYFWGPDSNLAPEYIVYGQSFINYYNGTKNYYGAKKTASSKGQGFYYVGTRKPNAWGLYDMGGLDWDWCLDTYTAGEDPATRQDAFTPYYVSTATAKRVRSRDAYSTSAADFRSSNRSQAEGGTVGTAPALYAFRISCIIPDAEAPGEE